jgi:hypothetical protein
MQLLLNLEERKVVTRALEKCLAQARSEELSGKRGIANRLLDRILEHDLRLDADELEDLSDILTSCKVEIKRRIADTPDPTVKADLVQQQKTLEHAADKVTEACMMA